MQRTRLACDGASVCSGAEYEGHKLVGTAIRKRCRTRHCQAQAGAVLFLTLRIVNSAFKRQLYLCLWRTMITMWSPESMWHSQSLQWSCKYNWSCEVRSYWVLAIATRPHLKDNGNWHNIGRSCSPYHLAISITFGTYPWSCARFMKPVGWSNSTCDLVDLKLIAWTLADFKNWGMIWSRVSSQCKSCIWIECLNKVDCAAGKAQHNGMRLQVERQTHLPAHRQEAWQALQSLVPSSLWQTHAPIFISLESIYRWDPLLQWPLIFSLV